MKDTIQDIETVSSQSAFAEGLAAVQKWGTGHAKSAIPLYTEIELYTQVWGMDKIHDHACMSNSDIKSLTLSLSHSVTDCKSLMLTYIDLTNSCLLASARHWVKTVEITWE